MPGISSFLNVAKVGILAHQNNLHVAANNVTNVNTDGYSRQKVTLSPAYMTPTDFGPVGNGVNVTDVTRDYDRFITTTLFDKTSVMSGLQTRQSGMKLIESVINEADTNGLNELLSRFWTSWDDVANNAEGTAERTSLLNNAQLLASGLKDRYNQLLKLSQDVDQNIQASVTELNKLADQVAELNVQIVAAESGHHAANDLRDQRDNLIKRLSEIAAVRYFETERGTYTVLIGQGNPLVEGNRSWHLGIEDNSVKWIGQNGQRVALTSEDVKNGELGGWMAIKDMVKPPDPAVLTSSRVNTASGTNIKYATRWNQIDGVTVTGDFSIRYSGTDQNGMPITGQFDYHASPESNATVGDFLESIRTAFQLPGPPPVDRVRVNLTDDGRIRITDIMPGTSPISFNIESVQGAVYGLNLGQFDKAYPPNYLEQINTLGTELIKLVNAQHSQGVGLLPLKETVGNFAALNTNQPIGLKASGLKFSSEVRDGSFQIWLYDKNGQVIDADPTTPEVNDPLTISITANSTTMEDIRDTINNAVFGGTSTPLGLSARILDGRLVIQADGTSQVAGFGFSDDTSGALLALGLNSFFTGYDAATIDINPVIARDVRFIAAAQVSPRGTDSLTSANMTRESNRPLGSVVTAGSFSISIYDKDGKMVDLDENQAGVNPLKITIDPTKQSLNDIIAAIDAIDGLHAEMDNGILRVRLEQEQPEPANNSQHWASVALGDDTTGLLAYLGVGAGFSSTQPMNATKFVTDPNQPLATPASGLAQFQGLKSGSFVVNHFDADGNNVSSQSITFDANTTTLNDLVTALNAIPGVNASISSVTIQGQTQYYLSLTNTAAGQTMSLSEDTSGILNALGLNYVQPELAGAFKTDRMAEPLNNIKADMNPGSFNIYLYDKNGQFMGVHNIEVNPQYDSLSDIAKRLNDLNDVKAWIEPDGRLHIETEGQAAKFVLADDTTDAPGIPGFLAKIGLMTPPGGILAKANNLNALTMRDLSKRPISNLNDATLNEAYHGIVGTVGIQSRGFQQDYDFSKAQVNELQQRRDSVSGVSLDEEMANLIRFQQAYTAAAKLIKMADEMFVTILETK